MKVEHQHIIKIPIDELREIIRVQYRIELAGIEPSLEGENLVFNVDTIFHNSDKSPSVTLDPELKTSSRTKRKRKRKRNRIKTRGWNVIAKVTNSKGLVANIYEPLVRELEDRKATRSEQYRIVREMLISNGNNPSDDSVHYFLNNTLEYLHTIKEGKGVS